MPSRSDDFGTQPVSGGPWRAVGVSGGGGREVPAVSPHDSNFIVMTSDMGSVHFSYDRGRTWRMVPMRQILACATCRPAFHPRDPRTLYAANGYRGLLKVTRDGGHTWQRLGIGLPEGVNTIAIDPNAPDWMLAGLYGWPTYTSQPAYRSLDGGNTWEPVEGLAGQVYEFHFDRTTPSEARVVFAGTPQGVFQSKDQGASWKRVGPELGDHCVAAFAVGSRADTGVRNLFCCVASADETKVDAPAWILRSADGGSTWERTREIAAGPGGRPLYLLVSDADPRRVYLVKSWNSPDDSLYRSDDSGTTWKSIFFVKQGDPRFNAAPNYINMEQKRMNIWEWSTTMAGIDPRDADHIMFSDYATGYHSDDGGHTWRSEDTTLAPGQDGPAIDRRWAMHGLNITTVWQYYIDPFESQRHYLCMSDMAFWHSEDAGRSWQWMRDLEPNCYELAFDPDTPGKFWGAFAVIHDIPSNNPIIGYHPQSGRGCVARSTDFGFTWQKLEGGLPNSCVISVIVDPTSPAGQRTLYAAVWDHGVYKSSDDGQTWVHKSRGLGAPGINMRCCRISRHGDGTLFCLITGRREGSPERRGGPPIRAGVGLYRSRDEGENWQCVTVGLDFFWPMSFETDVDDSNGLWLGLADWPGVDKVGGLYRSEDGGATWRRVVRKSHRHFGVFLHPRRPGWIYLALHASSPEIREPYGAGLWLSRDNGGTWEPFNELPFVRVNRVSFDTVHRDRIYVSTYGGGSWYGPDQP